MANIAVTVSGNSFNIDFGGYETTLGYKKKTFQKARISFTLMEGNAFVSVEVFGSPSFAVTHNGAAGTLQIDTVAGVAPAADNEDLYNKLVALL
jgi:hypothetical protein